MLKGLARDAKEFHARASEAKAEGKANPWQFVPQLGNWLSKKPWEAGEDPAPRDGGPPKGPVLSREAKEVLSELRRKQDIHRRAGDKPGEADYRKQADELERTGVIR